MTCPQCASRVSSKALWTATGLSGVVCPQCHASLRPKALGTIVVFALSIGLGEATLVLLQWRGENSAIRILAFIVVFAGVYSLAAPFILQMHLKEDPLKLMAKRQP